MPDLARLQLDAVSVSFPTPNGVFQALAPVDLTVPAGRFISLIGPSGCGKSTLFNVIAGLQAPTSGQVRVDGDDVTGMIGLVGYMLQKDLLLSWRTVLDNIVLGMEIRGVPVAEARERALPYLRKYGLAGFEHVYPSALSGGMRQRAALLRTLLTDTDIILLDEPFGALDAQTKSRMQDWLLQIWADFQKTVVFVTHDVEEAVYLSDDIYVMATRPGRIVERLDVPLARPRSRALVSDPRFIEIKEHCLSLLSHDTSDAPLAVA
ncbi:ABC transporter ATP-binding protein [Pigmentiphaga litoralis]|uniref:ABC-type nitrate/sulfonate/bicarbonate transport system ATPase subunit n=1 Tax=Pigmentiphaga litoralis TaxID=516702 RepID=A0A7Y9LLA9_9BURK|nr:ABC transporter ATP-binding protein [Pigmentiphaga litoralis]NYE24019.1 ABC-type nitrate/sulfonate/bicarbonate transport system ATPase subunit [Pigmentiphaga litoralis]NYE82367.1 ABC-type nitrate/sulfonate/bicarbonate transport system ATPase subunit [Pigmentiphaga litoralis]